MTTLTLRYIKGDFVVTGPDIEFSPVQDAPRGQGLVRGGGGFGPLNPQRAPFGGVQVDDRGGPKGKPR